MQRRHFINFHPEGFTFFEGAIVFDELKAGLTNAHDPHAVAIYYDEHKITYTPQTDNYAIRKLLEMDYDSFDARIQMINPQENPKEQAEVIENLLSAIKSE